MEDQKLKEIIEKIDKIGKERGAFDGFPSATVLECATKIYISERISEQQFHRQGKKQDFLDNRNYSGGSFYHHASSPADILPNEKETEPATQNQIAALKKMGYKEDTSKLNKYQAWILIRNKGKMK